MSADNCRECPRCAREASEAHEERKAEVRGTYGKIPQADFERQFREADVPVPPVGEMLREDYELWLDDIGGLFHVRYKASCAHCGFSHEFSHDEATSETGAEEVE